MAWDDEDFDIPASNKAVAGSWEDEEDDGELMESWDIDEEEVARKKKEAEAQKARERAALKAKQDEAQAKKAALKRGGPPALLDIDKVDERTRKDLLREAEMSSDLNNAADLFGGLGIAEDLDEHPREKANRAALAAAAAKPVFSVDTPLEEHPLFQPTNKQEYERLRKAVSKALCALADDSLINYSSLLAIDLIRDLTLPMLVESVRKAASTLNVIIKDKEREERQARLKKTGGTSSGGAGKKKAKSAVNPNVGGFKKNGIDEMDDGGFDDFDGFM